MNKFISVSAYYLRFPYGGHFKYLATLMACNKLATGSQPMIVVGIPHQWQTTAIGPKMNKFISVSTYNLWFPYGGHFKYLATFRACNMLATGSQPMIVVGFPNQYQSTAIGPGTNKFTFDYLI